MFVDNTKCAWVIKQKKIRLLSGYNKDTTRRALQEQRPEQLVFKLLPAVSTAAVVAVLVSQLDGGGYIGNLEAPQPASLGELRHSTASTVKHMHLACSRSSSSIIGPYVREEHQSVTSRLLSWVLSLGLHCSDSIIRSTNALEI